MPRRGTPANRGRMKKAFSLAYGFLCYMVFFVTFTYSIGFLQNLVVPKSIDSGTEKGLIPSLLINGLLLAAFAIQHSGMARQSFKAWWTRIVPAQIERSTYVLTTSLLLLLLFWQWHPMPWVIWKVQNPPLSAILKTVSWLGWGIVILSTFLISHFDLFGLRQVWLYFSGKPYEPVAFGTPWPYKIVRHPLYLGFLLAFWSTPVMTAGHLLFAVATTGYIFVGIRLEERDLMRAYGQEYSNYRQQVSMVLPVSLRKTGRQRRDAA